MVMFHSLYLLESSRRGNFPVKSNYTGYSKKKRNKGDRDVLIVNTYRKIWE